MIFCVNLFRETANILPLWWSLVWTALITRKVARDNLRQVTNQDIVIVVPYCILSPFLTGLFIISYSSPLSERLAAGGLICLSKYWSAGYWSVVTHKCLMSLTQWKKFNSYDLSPLVYLLNLPEHQQNAENLFQISYFFPW